MRIELFVDDPVAVHRQAVAAGGGITVLSQSEHQCPMEGPPPIQRMLEGSVVDPFGHMWLVGKILA